MNPPAAPPAFLLLLPCFFGAHDYVLVDWHYNEFTGECIETIECRRCGKVRTYCPWVAR